MDSVLTDPEPKETAWTSSICTRFHLTNFDIERINERYLFENAPLTKTDLNHELHKAECWLRDHPVRAERIRSWYKFLNNWLKLAEERRASGRGHAKGHIPTLSDADRTRSLSGRQPL